MFFRREDNFYRGNKNKKSKRKFIGDKCDTNTVELSNIKSGSVFMDISIFFTLHMHVCENHYIF